MSPSSNGRGESWRQACSARRPAVAPGHVGLGPGLVDEHQSRRIDALLMASPAPAMALYVGAILLACDERLFFERDANAAEEAAHHRRVGSHPRLRQQPVAKRLQSDVGFLRSQPFEILTMRLEPRTQVSAHLARRPRTAPFEALHPLDRRGLAHPKAVRSRTPAHPPTKHRVNHPVAQILRICTGHPCWPPSSQQVESEQRRFGNPKPIQISCSSLWWPKRAAAARRRQIFFAIETRAQPSLVPIVYRRPEARPCR